MRIAVIKPDHLGDLIIAIPTIRMLCEAGHEVTLYIASGNLALASYHFPTLERIALDLPHLDRELGAGGWSEAYKILGSLRFFDLVLFLRNDGFLTPSAISEWTDSGLQVEARQDRHQARVEQDLVAPLVGRYEIEKVFRGGDPIRFPEAPESFALAVGTGFPHKKWSPLAWAELGQMLLEVGARVEVFSGPGEVAESRMIARAIGLDERSDVFVGGADFAATDEWLRRHDLIIAVDGGSGHVASMVRPVLSLFGPSPARRFAPIGAANRLLTRDLPCSPCTGFDARGLNACMSRECMYGMLPQHVVQAIRLPAQPAGASALLDGGLIVKFGLSELSD